MTSRYEPHRTIRWPATTQRSVALAAAYLGLRDSETFIQASLGAAIASLADRDPTFALLLARSAGVSWENLEKLTKLNTDGMQS